MFLEVIKFSKYSYKRAPPSRNTLTESLKRTAKACSLRESGDGLWKTTEPCPGGGTWPVGPPPYTPEGYGFDPRLGRV